MPNLSGSKNSTVQTYLTTNPTVVRWVVPVFIIGLTLAAFFPVWTMGLLIGMTTSFWCEIPTTGDWAGRSFAAGKIV